MSAAQLAGIIRALMAGLGFVAMKYGVDEATWSTLSDAVVVLGGAALTIGTVAWSYYSNSTRGLVEQAAEQHEVKKIVTNAPLADSIDSGKVVSVEERSSQ
jgi:hypothetical protein